ncbi:hypothetical protein NVP1121O_186 [Vibrio phage 1.121.O._10N.286.46.C4]|nr:hypothetical protein NVP1121O_186 [Vibrio phage 1.121.O._10N.286.46.C4]
MRIELKIGRKIHNFTEEDLFLDNGACVQCKTKQGQHLGYGQYTLLRLTKSAVKTLDKMCTRLPVQVKRDQFNSGVEYFKYKLKEE